MTALVCTGLIAAACGGGSKKSNNANPSTATSESTTSTTATGATDSTVPGATTSSTAASAAGGTSATTAKKATTATTAKKSSVIPAGNKAVTAVQGGASGLTNVTSSPTTAQPGAQPGGTLILYKGSDQPALGPESLPVTGSFDMPDGGAIYDLMAYSDNGQVKPQAMESLTSTDALVWTVKMHPNMKFTDGTPWDAAAVKYNWARLQDPALKAIRAPIANQIAQMDVIDAVTLKVTLKSKNALFPGSVVLMPYIGSPTAEAKGADQFSQNPVGGGPFILKSWTRDSQKVFVRNPTYWNAPLPYLDGLTLKSVIDEVQRMNSFCADTSSAAVFIGAVGNANQMSKTNCGQVIPYGTNGGLNLFYNTTKPPMNNKNLRLGIAKAINFDDYSKVVDLGQIPPTHSVFRTDSPFYDPSILQPAYDPAGAQALFDQAAKDLGVDTITIPMGAFSVTAYANSAAYIQGALNKYNHIKIDLQTIGTSQHVTECTQRTYTGICHYGNPFDDPDPTFVSPYTCAATANPTGYCNPDFDKLVLDNETTLDPNQRIKDMKDLQKIFYADQPSLYVEYRFSWIGASNNLQNIHIINDGGFLQDQVWFKR